MRILTEVISLGLMPFVFLFRREDGGFNADTFATILAAVTTFINVLAILFFSWKKNKPEVKKLEAEGDSEIVDAAHSNLEGAQLVSTMLRGQIDELKKDLETEKKSRREDADYFRRRIKDIEAEARDYRLWAARLAKQVIEAGKVPVPFISSTNDADPLLSTIEKEKEQLEQSKGKREEEIKNAKDNT